MLTRATLTLACRTLSIRRGQPQLPRGSSRDGRAWVHELGPRPADLAAGFMAALYGSPPPPPAPEPFASMTPQEDPAAQEDQDRP